MLVDTSVWLDHLRRGNDALAARLEIGDVGCHPFVIGELACGNLKRRREILDLLSALPRLPVAEQAEVMAFVEAYRLMGHGIGWVDVHLLAAAKLGNTVLWTIDRRLAAAARSLGIRAEP